MSGAAPTVGLIGPGYDAAVGAMSAGRLALRSARAVARRPSLWPTAIAQVIRFAPDRWWRRPPFMPLPRTGLLRFRSETMYGDPARVPPPADLVVWLGWCRAQNSRRPIKTLTDG